MHSLTGSSFRISALTGAIILVAACGSPKGQTTTNISTIPDAPGPSAPLASSNSGAQTIALSKSVWDNFQAYLGTVGKLGEGYYAVTEDGQGGGSWACGETLCQGTFDGQGAAIKQCEAANPGKTCVVFAKDNRLLMNYEVAP